MKLALALPSAGNFETRQFYIHLAFKDTWDVIEVDDGFIDAACFVLGLLVLFGWFRFNVLYTAH